VNANGIVPFTEAAPSIAPVASAENKKRAVPTRQEQPTLHAGGSPFVPYRGYGRRWQGYSGTGHQMFLISSERIFILIPIPIRWQAKSGFWLRSGWGCRGLRLAWGAKKNSIVHHECSGWEDEHDLRVRKCGSIARWLGRRVGAKGRSRQPLRQRKEPMRYGNADH
jgi:hypothetical protein